MTETDISAMTDEERLMVMLQGAWDSERHGYWPAIDAMSEAAAVIRDKNTEIARLRAPAPSAAPSATEVEALVARPDRASQWPDSATTWSVLMSDAAAMLRGMRQNVADCEFLLNEVRNLRRELSALNVPARGGDAEWALEKLCEGDAIELIRIPRAVLRDVRRERDEARSLAAERGERIAELELALDKYGRHDLGCMYDTVSGLCSCKLYAALTRKTIERHNAALAEPAQEPAK